LIIRAILAVADAIPPSTRFTPPRENGMDAKSLSTKGEFDRGGRSIDKDLSCGDYLARHLGLLYELWIFEQMFEK
jgi:hypothetical protein